MTLKQKIRVFIFRRDLRIFDNTALLDACNYGEREVHQVLPIFIFNPNQVTAALNPYHNSRAIRFMLESLAELDGEISKAEGKLVYFENKQDTKVLEDIQQHFDIASVHFNMDLTPFAKARDAKIKDWCHKHHIACISLEDYTFHSINEVRTKTDNFYQVFTPFKNTCLRDFQVPPVNDATIKNNSFLPFKVCSLLKNTLDESQVDSYAPPHEDGVELYGGRSRGTAILEKIKKGVFKKYEEERNDAHAHKTTMLATYLKFGVVSIREAYHASIKGNGKNDSLVSELYWREFYAQLAYHKPELLQAQVSESLPNATHKIKMMEVKWKPATGPKWEAWCLGKTGYPFVDAGMRQLHATGFIHNRARMIVAMFLTKNLCMDWRAGEKYLAQHLLDYDPASNSGGWQWSASTGTDTQPYRIFNIWTQTRKYDPDCAYIKKWIPELRTVPNKDVLDWETAFKKHKGVYYEPIVDHASSAKAAKAMLKRENLIENYFSKAE